MKYRELFLSITWKGNVGIGVSGGYKYADSSYLIFNWHKSILGLHTQTRKTCYILQGKHSDNCWTRYQK